MKNLSLLIILVSSVAFSGEIGGVTLPDTLSVGSQSLALNGAGLRKKLFIKVYAGGLYLTAKSKDATAIVADDKAMAIRMHFIYKSVGQDKLIEAWNEGFMNATNNQPGALQAHIDAFNAMFTKEAKKDDVYDVTYDPGKGVSVLLNGTAIGTVNGGLEFKKAVFSIWLGKTPADKKLKSGMLAGK